MTPPEAFEQHSEKHGTALQRLEDWKSSAAKDGAGDWRRVGMGVELIRTHTHIYIYNTSALCIYIYIYMLFYK